MGNFFSWLFGSSGSSGPRHSPGASSKSSSDMEREAKAQAEAEKRSREEAEKARKAETEKAKKDAEQAEKDRKEAETKAEQEAKNAEQARKAAARWEEELKQKQREEEIRQKLEEEEAERIRMEREEYPMPKFLADQGGTQKVNMGLTGASGQGKSSLANYILGQKVAPTGSRETTMEPTPYQMFGVPLTIWDLPGAGTEKFPQDTYVQTMGLRWFDLVCIVSSERFTEIDIMLMNELKKHKVPHYMIRSKVDQDIENEIEDNEQSAEDTVRLLREDFKKKGLTNVYLITSKQKELNFSGRQHLYDNARLRGDILQDIAYTRGKTIDGAEVDDLIHNWKEHDPEISLSNVSCTPGTMTFVRAHHTHTTSQILSSPMPMRLLPIAKSREYSTLRFMVRMLRRR